MIRLELTVDKTELERQLNQVFGKAQAPGAAGGAAGAAGAGRLSFLGPGARAELAQLKERKRAQAEVGELEGLRTKPPATGLEGAMAGLKATSGTGGKGLPVTAGQGMLKVLGPIAALLGISLSVAGLLKLSKLAGSMLGALSSVIGAMIDSFLAPFMPLMAKGISWLARKGIPAAIKAGEKTFEWLAKVWKAVDGPLIFYLKLQWQKLVAIWDVLNLILPPLWGELKKLWKSAESIWSVIDGPVVLALNRQFKKLEIVADAIRVLLTVNEKIKEGQDKMVDHFTKTVPGFWKEALSGDRGKLGLTPFGKTLKGLIPGLDKGGIVPGQLGTPKLVMARAGEEYLGVGANRRPSSRGGIVLQPTFNFEITAENSIDATRMILRELEPEIMELVSRQFFTVQAQFSRV
jgi:hypothetical protein